MFTSHKRLAVTGAVVLAVAFAGCSAPEATAPERSADASPSRAPTPTQTVEDDPVAGMELDMSCTTADGATHAITVPREPSPDFTEAWALEGVQYCTPPALKVVPSTPVEESAYAASGYQRGDIATLFSLCAAVDARHSYIERGRIFTPAQEDEVRAILTLCPDHPFRSLYEANLAPAEPVAPTSPGDDQKTYDLTTAVGICEADAELTNLELNDALAPLLGFAPDRRLRSPDQDQAIRDHKTAAFLAECPERAS
jgi:hypothetical protein